MIDIKKHITKLMEKKSFQLSVLLAVTAFLNLFFQNCSQNGFEAKLDQINMNSESVESTNTNTGTNTSTNSDVKLKIAWDKSESPDVKGYKILIGNKSGQYDSSIDVGLTDTPEAPVYVLTTLKRGIDYYITAVAYSDSMESKSSNELYIAKIQ